MSKVLRGRSNAGLAIAVAALVLAMGGGSWALGAGPGHGHHHKRGHPAKLKRGARGPEGRQGPIGAQGPVGPAGPGGERGAVGARGEAGQPGANGVDGDTILSGEGAPGAALGAIGDFYIDTAAAEIYGPKREDGWGPATALKGPKGDTGAAGSTGADGRSVVAHAFEATAEPTGKPCEEHGGAEFEVEGSGEAHYICNGVGGGAELPEVMTGYWSVGSVPSSAEKEPILVSISYPFPLEAAPGKAGYVRENGTGSTFNCKGTAADPEPNAGHLCLYALKEVDWTIPVAGLGVLSVPAANELGTNELVGNVLKGETTAASGTAMAYGVWAIKP